MEYRTKVGDGRSTEELVEAGNYGYAHSCIVSDNFPTRQSGGLKDREIRLLNFDRETSTREILAEARGLGLEPPMYEDALYFGIEYPEAQQDGPLVFLHEPWVGFYGRRDVLCLWTNAGRRELGLEGYDETWTSVHRFAFVKPPT